MAQVEARQLQMHQVVPDFVLPSLDGRQVSPREYKQKLNLVIVYLNLQQCGEGCTNFLRELADNYHVYQDLETEILAVSPQPPSDLQQRLGNLGLPFPVLSDEGCRVGGVYLAGHLGEKLAGGIFVTDRYGALRAEMIAPSEGDLPNQQSILDWLTLIETECPECDGGEPREWR